MQAFSSWQAVTERQKALNSAARAVIMQLAHRTLGMALRSWRAHTAERVDLRHKAQLLVAAVTQARLRAAWLGWQAHVQRRRQAARMVGQALLRHSGHTLAMCFGGWQAVAAEQARSHQLLQHAVSALVHRQLSTAWRAWRQRAQERTRLRSLLAPALQQLHSRKAAAVLHAWRQWAARAATARRAVLAMQHRALSASFNTWLSAVEERKFSKAAEQRAGRLVRQAWARWRGYVALTQHKRQRLQQAALLCFGSLRARAWRAWRLHWERCRQKERVEQNFMVRQLRKCLSGWRQAAARVADLRARQEQVQQAAGQRMLVCVLAEWRWAARAAHFFRRYYLSRALATWVEHTLYAEVSGC